MLIATHSCCFKCLKEQNLPISICQNSHLLESQIKESSIEELINTYDKNILQESVVFAGLEPMLQFKEVYNFIEIFRKNHNDDIVIFTGYYEQEIQEEINLLKEFSNIYLKVGRFLFNDKPIYDNIGKITLASSNQKFIKIS